MLALTRSSPPSTVMIPWFRYASGDSGGEDDELASEHAADERVPAMCRLLPSYVLRAGCGRVRETKIVIGVHTAADRGMAGNLPHTPLS